MKFVIQFNLINEEQPLKIRDVVEKYSYEYVSVIPFTHEIRPNNPPLDGVDYIPYGSTLLCTLADELKWKGCYFDLETFNYEAFIKNRDDMLNSNIYTITEALEFLKTQPKDQMWFTRPSKDLKQYTGLTNPTHSCIEYFTNALLADTSSVAQLKPDTKIVLCETKNIDAEYRWFVVGRKVISGSLYRHSGMLFKERVTDKKIIDEAQTFADKWLPHENCVMDLALVDGEMKVIEFNCLNGSGFYDNDVAAIFDALWKYEEAR